MTPLDELRAHPRIATLIAALDNRQFKRAHDPAARRAGVAILIRLGKDGEPEMFFIQRAVYEGDPWSGQIAFPGGREEPGDGTLLGTAIRETAEEIGFDIRGYGEVVGQLDDLRPQKARLPAVVVRPFIVLVGNIPEPILSGEVASCFWVPLSVLLDRSAWRDTTIHAGGMEMSRIAFHHGGHVVWGMTERVLSDLLGVLR